MEKERIKIIQRAAVLLGERWSLLDARDQKRVRQTGTMWKQEEIRHWHNHSEQPNLQKTKSDCKICQTWKQMGCSSRTHQQEHDQRQHSEQNSSSCVSAGRPAVKKRSETFQQHFQDTLCFLFVSEIPADLCRFCYGGWCHEAGAWFTWSENRTRSQRRNTTVQKCNTKLSLRVRTKLTQHRVCGPHIKETALASTNSESQLAG